MIRRVEKHYFVKGITMMINISKKILLSALLFQCFFGMYAQPKSPAQNNVEEDESVIAWADKVPVVTMSDIERYKAQLIAENPQIEEMLKEFPEVNKNIGEILLQQFLVDTSVENSSISKSPGYKEDKENAIRMAVSAVNNKYFSEEISAEISLSDKELEKYYEAKKATIPGVQKERGGTKTIGVSFKTEKEAQNFAKKVGSSDLSQIATKDKLTVKDFGMLSATWSMNVDENVLAFALSATKFPQTTTLQDIDGNWWVIQAASKKIDTYYPFKEVKEAVAERALQEQIATEVTEKLTDLKKQYKVRINEAFFGGDEPLEITEQEVKDMIESLEELGGVLGEEGIEEIEER